MKKSLMFLWLSFTTIINIHSQDQSLSIDWLQSKASTTDRNILIVFSGSDLCKPCIQLDKEILKSSDFLRFQNDHLVVYKADFPYQKNNQPELVQREMNERLAEQYNPKGSFPHTVLLESDLKLIQSISYRSGMRPQQFIDQIKTIL